MAGKGSKACSALIAACAVMNIDALAKQYNICADVALSCEDQDEQRIALNVARAVHAIGIARFKVWEAFLEETSGDPSPEQTK